MTSTISKLKKFLMFLINWFRIQIFYPMNDYFKMHEAYADYLLLIQATLDEVDNFMRDSDRRPSGIKARDKLLELRDGSRGLRKIINRHRMLIESEY
jgi:hypothetical protein